jgi:glycosyltransferase involved in cell wall biosynthesis
VSAAPTVALNGRAAVRAHIGGVERYAREVLRRLPAISPGRYRLITPRPRLAHRSGHAWEQLALPSLARQDALIYSPANLAPVLTRRSVVVIHDVAPLARPESYSSTYLAYQRTMLPAIARRARLILTVSEFSKAEIVTRLGVAPARVEIAPGGAGPQFTADADARAAASVLGLTGTSYVLALGTDSARKNHRALTRVASALRPHGIDLVLAGSERGYLRGDGGPGVKRLGYVPEAVLPGLYAGARAFVMPSLYEGFGLPCVEAMACGTPVVAAASGALPETCGDAALLIDPDDPDALAAAVVEVAGDGATRTRLIEAGAKRAALFTWEATAERTDAALARVLETAD